MTASAHPSPADWRDLWIYFILVDRFANATGAAPAAPWDSEYGGFQGGTLAGIRGRLDFIRGLGAGAVWLSPCLKNRASDAGSYHGYGIQDFARVEPRFCSDTARARADPAVGDAELRSLVDAAHELGLYVILDIVLNHAGDVFAYDGFGAVAPWRSAPTYPIHWRAEDGTPNPAWATAPVDAPPDAAVQPAALRRDDAFRRLGNAFEGSPDPTTSGDFDSLKELVTELVVDGRYPVRDALIDCYADVIRRFDVDGFRIDTLMYVEPQFARSFGNAMREYALALGKRNFFTFGEIWSDEARISAFIGRHASDPDDLVGVDAALDYPLFGTLHGVLKPVAGPPARALADMYRARHDIEQAVMSSHGDASRFFVTFLDNHDQHERWRYEQPGDPTRYDAQVTLGLASLFCLQGVPCVYYGTEAGLHGAGDAPEAVRQALWASPDAFALDRCFGPALVQLSALRDQHAALRYGRQYFRPVSGDGVHYGHSPYPAGVTAWSRILADTELLIAANTSTADGWSGSVLVDLGLHTDGHAASLLYSNSLSPAQPGAIVTAPATVTDERDATTSGTIASIDVRLLPMEIQIIRFS
jgi:glycosidase